MPKMHCSLLAILAFAGTIQLAKGMVSKGRFVHGLIGYGINMYQPPCAFACRDSIESATLSCTPPAAHSAQGSGHSMAKTPPECYTTDEAFLTTLAYCVSRHCHDLPVWRIEKWWKSNVAGTQQVQPDPKWTFQEALAKIRGQPVPTYSKKIPLNVTSIISDDTWLGNYNGLVEFETLEITSERFGLIILLSGILIPIAFSLTRFLPCPSILRSRFNAWFVDPPAFGTMHNQPVFWDFFIVPTRGQAFFIAYLTAINVILSAIDIWTMQPNSWNESTSVAITTYVSNRVGVLSFVNMVLVFLYAGRNNFLLWVTDWSHATFLLVHRYVAIIATLQAIIHSVLWLVVKVQEGKHGSESKLSYWIWGSVATVAMTVLLHTSIHPIRQRCYELFLANHVILSVFVLVGCYLHIVLRFQHQWGYETWMWVVMAVWGFDRLVRFLRLARHGVKRAEIKVLDDDYVRLSVPGVSGSGHAYLYLPTLTWRFWENHPFSVATTLLSVPGRETCTLHMHKSGDVEKISAHHSNTPRLSDSDSASQINHTDGYRTGLTFLIRTRSGFTRYLRTQTSLPVLIEGNYGSHIDVTRYPTLIAIAGGVGITALLPSIRAHTGRTKLYWGVRSLALLEDMSLNLEGITKETFVGERMNILSILENELRGEKEEVCVLTSGPHTMSDEVQNVVTKLARRENVRVKLIVESFSW